MLDLDVIAGLIAVAVLAVALVAGWRLLAGRAAGTRWLVLRVAAAIVVALVVVSGLAYLLMNSRSVQLLGEHVARVSTSEKVVALTFDDGPSSTYVGEILADLAHYHAAGTFFVIGSAAESDPAALRRLIAAGEEIGNHTYSHRRLILVSGATVAREIETTDAVIRRAGYTGPILVRPPNGKKLLSAPYYLWRHGRTTVMWDLEPDSISAIAGNAEAMAKYVADNVRPGSIILLHPWYGSRSATRQALPIILEELAARGFRFVTVSQLLSQR